MKQPFLQDPIQQLQIGIFLLILCANLALFSWLLAAFAHMDESSDSEILFAGAALLTTLPSLWLGFRASRSRVYLNYRQAAQVYIPGIAISILTALLTHLHIQFTWEAEKPYWIIIATAGLFMVVVLSIKLSNSRHALD